MKTATTTARDALLSRFDAARWLGVGLRTFDGLIARRAIPIVRVGRRALFDPSDLAAFVARSKEGARSDE